MHLRVLFVEDSPDDVELMLRRLREAGIDAQWQRVESAAALREALAAEPWQVALVDFNLPSFSGPEAIGLLAELAPDTPAITVSGAISEETAVATITAGAVDYVLKDNLTRLAPAALRAVEGAELRRKERRAAAQARQTMYAVEHSSQAILYIGEDGTVLYANEAAASLGGLAAREAVGAPIRSWVPLLDEQRWAELWRAAAQHPIVDVEATLRLPSGEERLISATLDHHEHDEDAFVIVYARDVTEQRAVEERAKASEDRYERLADNAPDIIFRYDVLPTPGFTYINPAVEAITGYTPAECYADPQLMVTMVHPEDASLMAELMTSLAPPDEPLLMRWIGKDGVVRRMESRLVPLRDDEGRLLAVEGITRDVSERQRAQEVLRESEASLAEAQRTAHVGSWDWDIVSNRTTWSDEMYRLFGLSPAASDGSMAAVLNVVHPDDRERCVQNMEDNLSFRTTPPLEYRVILPDGVERTVYSTGVTDFDEAGAPVRNIGTASSRTSPSASWPRRRCARARSASSSSPSIFPATCSCTTRSAATST